MKHFAHVVNSEHSDFSCQDRDTAIFGGDRWYSSRHICELNPSNFILYFHGHFYLFTIHQCLIGESECSFLHRLIENSIKKTPKEKYTFETNRCAFNTELSENRKRGMVTQKWLDEIHYVYSNAAHAMFCITTRYKYLSVVGDMNSENIEKSYLEAREYLTNNGYEYMIGELDELYRLNRIYISEATTYKTTDLLIKTINHEISRKSKHESTT